MIFSLIDPQTYLDSKHNYKYPRFEIIKVIGKVVANINSLYISDYNCYFISSKVSQDILIYRFTERLKAFLLDGPGYN